MRAPYKLLVTSLALLLGACAQQGPPAATWYPPLSSASPLPAAPPSVPVPVSPDAPFSVAPQYVIDEDLFLVRALEDLYQHWPGELTPSASLEDWLAQARSQTVKLRETIRLRNLDPLVGSLYDDCLALLDAYESYLSNVGSISRNAVARAQSENTGVFFGSVGRVVTYGPLIGIVAGIGEAVVKSSNRDRVTQGALADEARRVKITVASTLSRAEIKVDQLAGRHRWRPAEAGFDDDSRRMPIENLQRRPRDPFVKASYANARRGKLSPEDAMKDASTLVEAARLVPEGRAYDGFRLRFVANAADTAVEAAVAQLPAATYSLGPAALAPDATRFCTTLLALDPADEFGLGNERLARALATAGRYPDALAAAEAARRKPKWRNDIGYSIRTAKLLSLTGRTNEVSVWLKQAYQLGFNDVNLIRKSLDFQVYRSRQQPEFAQLTTVRFKWAIEYGLIYDDIVITNQSPFDLTNVTFRAHVVKAAKVWDRELKAPSIAAGATFKFPNVMSVPKDTPGEASAVLQADQSAM